MVRCRCELVKTLHFTLGLSLAGYGSECAGVVVPAHCCQTTEAVTRAVNLNVLCTAAPHLYSMLQLP